MKVAVISCNLNSFDKKYTNCIQKSNEQIDYFYLDNSNFVLRKNSLHPRLQAKIPKMLAWQIYKDYDFYIWLDASITFSNENSVDWLINLCKEDIAFFRHFERNSIQEEFLFMSNEMSKGNSYLLSRCEFEFMKEQVEFYLSHKDFNDSLLFACGVFIYSKKLISQNFNIMEQWFYHCSRWSIRDQLSIPFLLWLNKIKFNIIQDHLLKNIYIQYHGH